MAQKYKRYFNIKTRIALIIIAILGIFLLTVGLMSYQASQKSHKIASEILHKGLQYYKNGDIDSALLTIKSGAALPHFSESLRVDYDYWSGKLYYERYGYDSIEIIKEYLETVQLLDNGNTRKECDFLLAKIHTYAYAYDEAFKIYSFRLNKSKTIGDTITMIETCANIFDLCYRQDEPLLPFIKAIGLSEIIPNKITSIQDALIRSEIFRLAYMQSLNEENNDVIANEVDSLCNFILKHEMASNNDTIIAANIYRNLAYITKNISFNANDSLIDPYKLKLSAHFYQKAIKYFEYLNNYESLSRAQVGLSDLYAKQRMYLPAISLLDSLDQSRLNRFAKLLVAYKKANNYFELGRIEKSKKILELLRRN